MISDSAIANTPVYGGYHPNDLGYQWFSNFRVDSKVVIGFFNLAAMKMSKLIHVVNRGELHFRTSDGGFTMQAIRVRTGLSMVLKAWLNDNDKAHAEILRQDLPTVVSGTVEDDTLTWLMQVWDALQSLVAQAGLKNIRFPDFEELIDGGDGVQYADPPEFFSEYSGSGEASSYEEPSYSSELGDLPDLRM